MTVGPLCSSQIAASTYTFMCSVYIITHSHPHHYMSVPTYQFGTLVPAWACMLHLFDFMYLDFELFSRKRTSQNADICNLINRTIFV